MESQWRDGEMETKTKTYSFSFDTLQLLLESPGKTQHIPSSALASLQTQQGKTEQYVFRNSFLQLEVYEGLNFEGFSSAPVPTPMEDVFPFRPFRIEAHEDATEGGGPSSFGSAAPHRPPTPNGHQWERRWVERAQWVWLLTSPKERKRQVLLERKGRFLKTRTFRQRNEQGGNLKISKRALFLVGPKIPLACTSLGDCLHRSLSHEKEAEARSSRVSVAHPASGRWRKTTETDTNK